MPFSDEKNSKIFWGGDYLPPQGANPFQYANLKTRLLMSAPPQHKSWLLPMFISS